MTVGETWFTVVAFAVSSGWIGGLKGFEGGKDMAGMAEEGESAMVGGAGAAVLAGGELN